ncbi:PP2C family protein-serine/threonine phosphatase [Streptomyces sp. NPDC055966]|uniref:PP2C family protein-serine/threonine phosphatase n=1 Tax=Streptomyces sp. NPDC055966 TaxID=3345669 RepID=UPI0035E38850
MDVVVVAALLALLRTPPSAVLTRLDPAFQAITDVPVTTACLARIEPAPPAGWTLDWSTAGHPPPLLISPGQPTRYLYTDPALPLGVDTAVPRHDHTHPLPEDSTMVFFTDGVIEHHEHPIEEGLGRLTALATAHAGVPLADFVQTLADRHPSDGHDDMAILALRIPQAAPTSNPVTLTVVSTPPHGWWSVWRRDVRTAEKHRRQPAHAWHDDQ